MTPGLVHHSDRGTQYASYDYTELLAANQIAMVDCSPAGSRLRFPNRAAVCGKLVLPVEAFSSNGVLCLNCLSHARGQAEYGFIQLRQALLKIENVSLE
jgi:hypothetical protein